MLVQQFKPRSSEPQRYGVEQLGPAGAGARPDPQLLQRLGTQGFPGSPVLGVVVLLACAQARYSVPEPRVCGRLRLRRLSEGSQVTFCYKGSTYLLIYGRPAF